jgi:hypothetical protein
MMTSESVTQWTELDRLVDNKTKLIKQVFAMTQKDIKASYDFHDKHMQFEDATIVRCNAN